MLVTGMIIGSCFTLFVVPSIYVLVARTHKREEIREPELAPKLEPAALSRATVDIDPNELVGFTRRA